jgi:hypothetical protein
MLTRGAVRGRSVHRTSTYEISAEERNLFVGSSDPRLGGDPSRYNPEDLLRRRQDWAPQNTLFHLSAYQRATAG